MIADQMNGRDLSQEHGYPVRAVVPGHFGMASVKWLTRVQAVREPFRGYWQTSDYGYWHDTDGHPVRRGLGAMHLKSQIARPRRARHARPNQRYVVSGRRGPGPPTSPGSRASTDGGHTWADAELLDPVQPYVWRRWRYEWLTPNQPGRYTLIACATVWTGASSPRRMTRTTAAT